MASRAAPAVVLARRTDQPSAAGAPGGTGDVDGTAGAGFLGVFGRSLSCCSTKAFPAWILIGFPSVRGETWRARGAGCSLVQSLRTMYAYAVRYTYGVRESTLVAPQMDMSPR